MIKEILENEINEGFGLTGADVTNEVMSKNSNAVHIGKYKLFFSYNTLVAIEMNKSELLVAQNIWSNTTARMLSSIDGGSKEAKAKRVPQADLLKFKLN